MEHNISTENATRWSKMLFATAMIYLFSSGITLLPEGNVIFDTLIALTGIAFFILWLSFPYVLYKDRKQIYTNTDWRPSKLYYFGFLPSLVGTAVILLYLYRRNKTFDEDNDDLNLGTE